MTALRPFILVFLVASLVPPLFAQQDPFDRNSMLLTRALQEHDDDKVDALLKDPYTLVNRAVPDNFTNNCGYLCRFPLNTALSRGTIHALKAMLGAGANTLHCAPHDIVAPKSSWLECAVLTMGPADGGGSLMQRWQALRDAGFVTADTVRATDNRGDNLPAVLCGPFAKTGMTVRQYIKTLPAHSNDVDLLITDAARIIGQPPPCGD